MARFPPPTKESLPPPPQDQDELDGKYEPITPEEAEEEWQQIYDGTLTHCIHGQDCKQGPSCTVGGRGGAGW